MKHRKITVFGGSGFVGSALVAELLRRDNRVVCAVRRPMLAQDVSTLSVPGQFRVVAADVRSRDDVAAAVAGADAAVNLVGKLYEAGEQTFSAIHQEGARIVAQACADAGVHHLVHVSALGSSDGSNSGYARTKAAGEQAVLAAFPRATILRPSVIYGPGDGFFCRFEQMSRLSPFIPLIGGGKTKFQPVYLQDVVAAIITSLSDSSRGGRSYSLGGDQVVTFRQAMEMMLRCAGRKRIMLPIPWVAASAMAMMAGLAPSPLLTADQVRLLRSDNVVEQEAIAARRTLAGMGITATSLEAALPRVLGL